MSISAAIIVKDEERVIDRCLTCVKQFADEIVVVDTGSTDATKRVIKEKHPDVSIHDSEHFTPETPLKDFNFGKAKNEAIKRCTGDWVIWWDADDFIDRVNAEAIKELGMTQGSGAYEFTVVTGNVRVGHVRMFRNGQGILFDETHSCHEYLNVEATPAPRRDIVIQHVPVEQGHAEKSAARNRVLLEADYARGKRDPRTLFYLANRRAEDGDREDAIPLFRSYLEVSRWKEERLFARIRLAACLSFLGRKKEALVEGLLAVAEDDRYAEPYCAIGDMYFESGDERRAAGWYAIALALGSPPEDARLFVAPSKYGSYPRKMLQKCRCDAPSTEKQPSRSMTLKDVKMKLIEGFPEGSEREVPSKSAEPKSVVEVVVPKRFCGPCDFVLALSAARAFGEWTGKEVKVSAADGYLLPLVDAAALLPDGEPESVMEVDAPEDTKDRGKFEWFCRSLGVVGASMRPLLGVERGDLVVLCRDDEAWAPFKWERLADSISGGRVSVERELSVEAMRRVATARAVFCFGDHWARHVAAVQGVPALVVWARQDADAPDITSRGRFHEGQMNEVVVETADLTVRRVESLLAETMED